MYIVLVTRIFAKLDDSLSYRRGFMHCEKNRRKEIVEMIEISRADLHSNHILLL